MPNHQAHEARKPAYGPKTLETQTYGPPLRGIEVAISANAQAVQTAGIAPIAKPSGTLVPHPATATVLTD